MVRQGDHKLLRVLKYLEDSLAAAADNDSDGLCTWYSNGMNLAWHAHRWFPPHKS